MSSSNHSCLTDIFGMPNCKILLQSVNSTVTQDRSFPSKKEIWEGCPTGQEKSLSKEL